MPADRISIQLGVDTGPLADGLGQANAAVQASADRMNQTWAALTTQTTAQFAAVNESIQSSFAGIGTKAEAAQAALQAANAAIAGDFARLGQSMTSSWDSSEAAMTASSQNGAATRLSTLQTAISQGLSSMAQNALKAITNNALASFSGVFANLAPSLGLGAAAPAAAAQATVAAAAGGIASAAGGWQVPEDQLAYVHKDEKILPARYSQGLDAMVNNALSGQSSGGGGGDVHLHINAIDTQSAAAFLDRNMGQIVSGLKRGMRNFAFS